RARGVTQEIGQWGLADRPFLLESLRILEEQASQGQPLFAHLLTITTHHPHSVIPEGPIPAAVKSESETAHQRYLSRLRYADEAIGDFFDSFFESPLARNSVVVLLGDHGTTTRPDESVTKLQFLEMRFRIPFAVISKNIRTPAVVRHPVHQVDVAPTVARIAGVGGETSWIGSGLFSGNGRPWIYDYGDTLHYRTGDRACYSLKEGLKCFDVTEQDPLYDARLKEVGEHPEDTAFFRKVLRANQQVLSLNRLLPKNNRVRSQPVTRER
ncbi:MAG: sulfatase-like hydrolase/transferase, partial [Myxococcota bacterium]